MLTRVLVAGRSANAVRTLQAHFNGVADLEARINVITNGHVDPLQGLDYTPDVVILHFEAQQTAELSAWAARPKDARPALIVIGSGGHPEVTRLAIRSGAHDFLSEPVGRSDLLAAVAQVRAEKRAREAGPRGSTHAFVSVAGGAGSSFLASNVAYLLAAHAQMETAIVDLDVNFAPVAHHLNLRPERSLLEALETVQSLDAEAIAGYGVAHASGLRLYCSTTQHAVLGKDVPADRLPPFIELLAAHRQHVVIDVPHVIDGLTATALGLAADIHVVLQQSTLHVRNATRLLRILRDELSVPAQRIHLLVNRHSGKAALQLDDMSRALGVEIGLAVPSDYRRASESSDAGVPLFAADRDSPIARALMQVVRRITGIKDDDRGSLLRRALPSFLRSSP